MENSEQTFHILVADDDPDDQYLIRSAMTQTGQQLEINCVQDGEQTLHYLQRLLELRQPLPHLILLDLNMPMLDGIQTLEKIKANPHLCTIPVVIYTTSASVLDIHDAYSAGANAYMTKPLDFSSLNQSIKQLIFYWQETVQHP